MVRAVMRRRALTIRQALLCSLAAILILAGCNGSRKKIIGVVPKGTSHLFWVSVQAGAMSAGHDLGVEVLWNGPATETEYSRQIEIVDSMINRRLAGIVLAPVDRRALVGVVERAARQGIPVSIFDSAIDSERIVSYVATDNIEGGRMAARRLGELLNGKGKVGVIGFMPGSASTSSGNVGPHMLSRAVVVTTIGRFSAFAALAKATTLCFSSPVE